MSDRSPRTTYSADPLNLGTPTGQLHATTITPTEHFFVRNHGPIPQVSPDDYRLTVDGLVAQPLALSLADLQARLPQHTVTATLQCAGHRRRELNEVTPIDVGEIVWDADAISTAVWRGVRLCDLLALVEPQAGAAHVAFLGMDSSATAQEGFGASIPLTKAQETDVLLAWEMNGAPLLPTHGFPLRALIPGYIGARSVKWLNRITLQAAPSTNYFQAHAYKRFPPDVRHDTANWEQGEMLGPLPINSFITNLTPGAQVAQTPLTVQGIAVPGSNATLVRVELSCDGGRSWQAAKLTSPVQQWVWSSWEAVCDLPRGEHELVVRAVDSAGHSQPKSLAEAWNFKGYVNNAWQRLRITRV